MICEHSEVRLGMLLYHVFFLNIIFLNSTWVYIIIFAARQCLRALIFLNVTNFHIEI